MKRREFIALLGSATVALSFAAWAEKAKPVIAILGSGAADAGSSKQLMSMLDASMREVGLSQGQDYVGENARPRDSTGVDFNRHCGDRMRDQWWPSRCRERPSAFQPHFAMTPLVNIACTINAIRLG